jgi:hypothetical protein
MSVLVKAATENTAGTEQHVILALNAGDSELLKKPIAQAGLADPLALQTALDKIVPRVLRCSARAARGVIEEPVPLRGFPVLHLSAPTFTFFGTNVLIGKVSLPGQPITMISSSRSFTYLSQRTLTDVGVDSDSLLVTLSVLW